MNTNLLTNLVALSITLLSFLFSDPWHAILLSIGLFALSGALTNWLAIHMLFERIPGIYGSGVITLHFEEFKSGILRMVRQELFNREKVESLLSASDTARETARDTTASADVGNTIDLEPILKGIDLDIAFDQLVATVMESSLGGMLGMFGGQDVLEQLREPFRQRMSRFLEDVARSPKFVSAVNAQLASAASSDRFLARLDALLRARLDELTPEMVRDLMQRMIRKHLGWLVIWGGLFGGLIGLIAALLQL